MKSMMQSLNIVSDVRIPLITRVYRLGLTLLIPLLGFSIIYFWHSGFLMLAALPVVAIVALVIGASTQIKHSSRAWIFTIILFGFGVTDLFLFGWMSDARIFLLASIFVGCIFLNKSAGYSFWAGGIVLTASYLFMTLAGWITSYQTSSMNTFAWRIVREWLVFLIIGGGFVWTAGYWLNKLANEVSEINARQKLLCDEKKNIEDQIITLNAWRNNLQKRESMLEATSSVIGSLTSLQPLNTVVTLSVNLISQSFGFEHVAIYLMDESERLLKLCAASSEAGRNLLAQDYCLNVDESSIVGWVAANHQSKCHTFKNGDTKSEAYPGFTSLQAELAIPIFLSGDILGVLDIQSSDPATFDDFTVNTVKRLVSELTLVFNSAHRLDDIPMFEIVNPFFNAVQRIASARTDHTVYATVLELLHVYTPSRLTFFRIDDDTDEFYTVFDSINGQSSFVHQSLISLENPLLNSIVQYGTKITEPVWLEKDKLHLSELPKHLNERMLNEYTVHSVGVLPVLIRDKVIGVVISLFDAPHQFSQLEKRFHRVVTTLTAEVLERNTLINETTIRSEQEDVLNRIRTQFRSTMDPDIILRKTTQELGQLLGAEETYVHLLAHEKLESSRS